VVLARVAKDKIAECSAYEFFKCFDKNGNPIWTKDIQQRGAVFNNFKKCYRMSVSYNVGLERYLLCQTLPGEDTRFEGGFGIYDAPEPWGPWTTVFYTERWDVGPGETSSFPTMWISSNGRTAHLVFSGQDCFSVRRCEFRLSSE